MPNKGQDQTENTTAPTNLTNDTFEHEISNSSFSDSLESETPVVETLAFSAHQVEKDTALAEPCLTPSQSKAGPSGGNVVSLFSNLNQTASSRQILEIYPETSGIKMLYATDDSDRCIAVPIICWALRADGEISGMVPWLNDVLDCETIADRFDLTWEGYYDDTSGDVFYQAPGYAVAMLTTSARFKRDQLDSSSAPALQIVDEFADQLGTHAMQLNEDSQSLTLSSVISWQLDGEGNIHGMLADESRADKYPVLVGDDCLYRAQENIYFRCFFQRDIAEQIRERDPETLRAIERLFIEDA